MVELKSVFYEKHHLYSLISSITSGSHSLYFSSSDSMWVRSSLRAFSSFSRELLSFCTHAYQFIQNLKSILRWTIVWVKEAHGNILTVSWRPSLAFSTAFSRDTFRCFACKVLKANMLYVRPLWHQIATREKGFLWLPAMKSILTKQYWSCNVVNNYADQPKISRKATYQHRLHPQSRTRDDTAYCFNFNVCKI